MGFQESRPDSESSLKVRARPAELIWLLLLGGALATRTLLDQRLHRLRSYRCSYLSRSRQSRLLNWRLR